LRRRPISFIIEAIKEYGISPQACFDKRAFYELFKTSACRRARNQSGARLLMQTLTNQTTRPFKGAERLQGDDK
jgi:hypothetical protein